MTEQECIEQEIRNLLATETQAISLSNKLFRPDGLFGRLGDTEQKRHATAQSPLFRQAQNRLTELQRLEAAAFAEALRQGHDALPEGNYLLKLEGSAPTPKALG
jgi:hypothetical protein